MRNLARIEIIDTLTPIEGADFIEQCTLKELGWNFVVKKDEFKVGDFCVFFEIDSLLPDKEWSDFMKPRKFRVKTIKLKGVISQGLALPLSYFPELSKIKLKKGLDVTDILGVTKYLTPTEKKENDRSNYLNSKSKFEKLMMRFSIYRKFKKKLKEGKWPNDVTKTDEPRIQNFVYKNLLNEDRKYYVTEKIDYQSVTFFSKTHKFLFLKKKYTGACSRNIWLKNEDESLYWKIFRKYNFKSIFNDLKEDYIIQGEQGDTNIQDNKYGIKEPRLWIFNIIRIDKNGNKYHFDYNEMKEFCDKYNLEAVPLLFDNFKLPDDKEDLIKMSDGKSVINKNTLREGIVVRCVLNGIKYVSFKVISPKFLLKYEGD